MVEVVECDGGAVVLREPVRLDDATKGDAEVALAEKEGKCGPDGKGDVVLLAGRAREQREGEAEVGLRWIDPDDGAGKAVWNLLEIIFDVVSPGAD